MSSSEIKPFKETGIHSYHRRAFSHNYFAPYIYHIILKKTKTCPRFGKIAGDSRISPGQPGCAYIEESEIGKIIAKAIIHLPFEFKILRIFQFCVMPDHVHLLIQILFRSDKHLDFYIDSLKCRIAKTLSERHCRPVTTEEIFEPGYCDKPLYDNRSLDTLFRYVRENPHRLAVRMQFPQFFQRRRCVRVGEEEFEAYGNLFLLRNPDKEAVRISRSFSEEENARKKADWLYAAARGTILVSPFISHAEKTIRSEAEALGAKIILITHEAFTDRFKPSDHDFTLCSEGRLLILTLGREESGALSRATCLQMNDLARAVAEN